MSTATSAPATSVAAAANSKTGKWSDWLSYHVNTVHHSGFPLFFWVRPHWSVKQMKPQNGKVSFLHSLRKIQRSNTVIRLQPRALINGRH